MKNFFITIIILLVTALSVRAQTTVSGIVVEKDNGNPLPGASVVIKNAEGKIKKFTSTKTDGSFSITLAANEDMTLEVSMISKFYRLKKQNRPLKFSSNQKPLCSRKSQ